MCLFKPLAVKLLNYRFCQQGTHNIHNTLEAFLFSGVLVCDEVTEPVGGCGMGC